MATTADTIDHTALARLVEAGAVRGAEVIGQGDSWGVVVKYGATQRALAVRRGAARRFRRFETLVAYLKKMGIAQYSVNAADFDPQATQTRRARPDAARRMRSAFEAKAHADWVNEKVAQSLADPRPNIAHRQVMEQAQALIDARRKRRAPKAAP